MELQAPKTLGKVRQGDQKAQDDHIFSGGASSSDVPSQAAVSHDEQCRSNTGLSQRPGGKGERMSAAQAGSSQVDKMDNSIYLRHLTTWDSSRFLCRDWEEDVAGTRGHRSSETITDRDKWKQKSACSGLALCAKKWW